MTWLPLIVVSIGVMWLRFRAAEWLISFGVMLVGAVLEEHGSKTLFNGNPSRPVRPPAMNRHARRLRRWEQLRG